jgi:hypothetical protein
MSSVIGDTRSDLGAPPRKLVARKGQEKGNVGECSEIGNCKSNDFKRLRMAVNDT